MSKQATIKERGGRSSAEKNAKTIRDTVKKFQQPPTVVESTLLIDHLTAVAEPTELFHLIDRVTQRYARDEYPTVDVDKQADSILYHFSKKRVALSIARQIQRAYKHLRPEIIIQNPYDHQFERIVLNFNDSRDNIL